MAKQGRHSIPGWAAGLAGLLLLVLAGILWLGGRPPPSDRGPRQSATVAALATGPAALTRSWPGSPSTAPPVPARADRVSATPSPLPTHPDYAGLTATAVPTLPLANYAHLIRAYAFAGGSIWIAIDNTLLQTTDDGQHWTELRPIDTHAGFAMAFLDADHGWILAGGEVEATADGGRHWVKQVAADRAPSFISPQQGWALAGSSLLVTHNGGTTWQPTGNARPLRAVQFFDALHGWSFLNDAVPHPDFYYTWDGGKTWLARPLPDCRWYKMRGWFVPSGPRTGWVACGPDLGSEDNSFSLSQTTDGGQTWQRLPPPDSGLSGVVRGEAVGAPFFLDDHHGWITIVGEFTLLRATADGGQSWTNRALLRGVLEHIRFASLTRGYAIAGSALLSTQDGGATWTPIYYVPPPPGTP